MIKKCTVCGAEFNAPPSSKKITCTNSCSISRKKESHFGKSNIWSKSAKGKLSERGRTENLKKGTPAAKLSPVSGPFETNQEAKFWIVIDPQGIEYEVVNLALFCRVNSWRFLPNTHQQAYSGLREVNKWMSGKSKRTVSQWKGWTLKQASKEVVR